MTAKPHSDKNDLERVRRALLPDSTPMMGDAGSDLSRKESWRMKQKIHDKSDEREELHKKTFTKWMNVKLARRDPPTHVNDLIEDIQDGRLLLDLLEVLLGTKLKREKGKTRVHKLNNIKKAMELLEENNVKLVGISSYEIADGKTRAVLALMWTIILRFQVQDVMKEAVTEESIQDFSIEKKILHWCHERLKKYRKTTKITDFSLSWKNGMAFNGLVHSYKPELFDFDSLQQQSTHDRLNHAFTMATTHFGVPHLLEASDIDVERPDKRLIIMYLCTLYDYLEGSMAKEAQILVQENEETEGAANDSWDALDSTPKLSAAEHDEAVRGLSGKLDDIEAKISQAENDKPTFNKKESVDSLENSTKALDEHKKFLESLQPLKSEVDGVLADGRRQIQEGYFDKGEEEEFGQRMGSIDDRMRKLMEHSKNDKDQLSQGHVALLKKQLKRIASWVKKGEAKKAKGNGSSEYEKVNKELDDHQKFQDELDDIAVVTLALGLDGSDHDVSPETREEAKELGPRWKEVWDWSENHKNRLISELVDWQEFRAEELVMLNWLATKEKMLPEVLQVDVADEGKVQEQLDKLEVTQKELEEQDLRLKKLHDLGEKLIGKVGEDSPSAEEIRKQLADFDDCWEQVAKRVIDGKERLISSSKKMKELQEYMDNVNDWIDEAEKTVNEYNDDMNEEEKNKIKDKIEIKCEEMPATEQKVDRINRLGEDLGKSLDGPSTKAIKEDVKAVNERWKKATAAMDSFSDKGYPDNNNNECCLFRIIKRKLFLSS